MVILNSPANPTGGALDRELNVEIARILADHDCWILTDEMYSELLYEGVHDTVAAHGLLDRTILLDGFSKTYAMTGWRLGYAAVPPALIEPLSRFLINSVACTRAGGAAGRGRGAHRPARRDRRDGGRVPCAGARSWSRA